MVAPNSKHVSGWLIVAVTNGAWFLERYPHFDWKAWLMATVAAWAAVVAIRAYQYNTHILPQVAAAWDSSLMCGLCGHVFVPSSALAGPDSPALSRDLRLLKTK